MRQSRRPVALSVLTLVGLALLALDGAAARGALSGPWTVGAAHAGDLQSALPRSGRVAARAAANWCGSATQTDLAPNGVAGNPVHWIYAIPSDGQDRLTSVANEMQTDADTMETWWRGQDPTRVPRNDVAVFSCGTQLDISSIRLAQSSAQLGAGDAMFDAIANSLISRGFSSHFTKYVVYFDGSVSDTNLCGEGGSDPSGLGYAVVFDQSCPGIPTSVVATHELTHTFGAVPSAAPHNCPPPHDGHVCDDTHDLMYWGADGTPLSGLTLDTGRDDYYGHSGSWLDVQDSAWLVQLDRQTPLAVSIAGPGSVAADVPGLQCSKTCTTTWNAGTSLALTATPSAGAKLVHWGGACTGSGSCSVSVSPSASVSALFAPMTYRLTVGVAGKGAVRSSSAGIACPARCSSAFASYQAERLTAKPAKGWRLAHWYGACRGTRLSCTVPMTKNTSARAVFRKA